MRSERFYKNQFLPFAELRHSRRSTASFKPHIHPTMGIGAVDEGEVLYTVEGEKGILAPGSLVIINPEALHTCNPKNERARSYSMLHLDTAWCFQVQQSMWDIDRFARAEKIRIDNGPLYEQYCKTAVHLTNEKIHLQEKEQMLFDLASSVFSAACKTMAKTKEHNVRTDKLKKLLSADLQKDFTLNSIATALDANPYTLIRSFKAATGLTPHAYRMNCRIAHARKLLRQGRDIADTALECGFFDQSHFHRHFRSMTTVTPQEYRVNFIQSS